MSESLESLALEAAGDIDDGKTVAGLSELLRALAGACRERDALRSRIAEQDAQINRMESRLIQSGFVAAERDALSTRVSELEHLADAAMARAKAAEGSA